MRPGEIRKKKKRKKNSRDTKNKKREENMDGKKRTANARTSEIKLKIRPENIM